MRSYFELQAYPELYVAKQQITGALARSAIFLCGGYCPKELPQLITKFNNDYHALYGPKAKFARYDNIDALSKMIDEWLMQNSDILNWQFDIENKALTRSTLVAMQTAIYVWNEVVEECENFQRTQNLLKSLYEVKKNVKPKKAELKFMDSDYGVIMLWSVAAMLMLYILKQTI